MRIRAAVVSSTGPDPAGRPEVGEVELADPGPGQLLVEVEASGVAFADVLMRRGLYPAQPRPPFTPGYDVVGRVLGVGEGADPSRVGTRVAALTVTGGNATHALVPAHWAVEVPASLDAAATVALVLNYVTAWQLLHRVAAVPEGGTVLVLGAAGGVGTALLELCDSAGITAVGTASGERTEVVRDLGGIAVDRSAGDLRRLVAEAAPGPIAATFDPVGGPSLRRSRSLTDPAGTVVSYGIGFGSPGAAERPARSRPAGRVAVLARHAAALGAAKLTPGAAVRSYVIAGPRGSADRDPGAFCDDLAGLVRLLAAGEVSPVVTRLPLADVAIAQDQLAAGTAVGKLVLVP